MLENKTPLISFEFFPPREGNDFEQLSSTIEELTDLKPAFVSITYGAGGSTREKTVQLVAHVKKNIGLEAMAHLTCVGHTREELLRILDQLQVKAGIENVMALRGDPPKGVTTFVPPEGGYSYASQLVELIKKNFDFSIGCAGYPEKHPEAPSLEVDLNHLKEKVNSGADFVVTQLFFDNNDYFSFVKKARLIGITVPIIPGIMPIKDYNQITKFASLCAAKIPVFLRRKLEAAKNSPEETIQIGIEHAIEQCRELIKKGAPGIHFYTLNKSKSTVEIFRQLRGEHLL